MRKWRRHMGLANVDSEVRQKWNHAIRTTPGISIIKKGGKVKVDGIEFTDVCLVEGNRFAHVLLVLRTQRYYPACNGFKDTLKCAWEALVRTH